MVLYGPAIYQVFTRYCPLEFPGLLNEPFPPHHVIMQLWCSSLFIHQMAPQSSPCAAWFLLCIHVLTFLLGVLTLLLLVWIFLLLFQEFPFSLHLFSLALVLTDFLGWAVTGVSLRRASVLNVLLFILWFRFLRIWMGQVDSSKDIDVFLFFGLKFISLIGSY